MITILGQSHDIFYIVSLYAITLDTFANFHVNQASVMLVKISSKDSVTFRAINKNETFSSQCEKQIS